MEPQDDVPTATVVIWGPSWSGKTTLARAMLRKPPKPTHSPFERSAGVTLDHRMIRTPAGQFVKVQIWDFPSHAPREKLLQEVARADGVILVYDAQSPASLAQMPAVLATLPQHSHKFICANLRGAAHSAADHTAVTRQRILSSHPMNASVEATALQHGGTGRQLAEQFDAHFIEGCAARTEFAELALLAAVRATSERPDRHAVHQSRSEKAVSYVDADVVAREALERGTGRTKAVIWPWKHRGGDQYLGKPPVLLQGTQQHWGAGGAPHSDVFGKLCRTGAPLRLGIHFTELWNIFCLLAGSDEPDVVLESRVQRGDLMHTLSDQELLQPAQQQKATPIPKLTVYSLLMAESQVASPAQGMHAMNQAVQQVRTGGDSMSWPQFHALFGRKPDLVMDDFFERQAAVARADRAAALDAELQAERDRLAKEHAEEERLKELLAQREEERSRAAAMAAEQQAQARAAEDAAAARAAKAAEEAAAALKAVEDAAAARAANAAEEAAAAFKAAEEAAAEAKAAEDAAGAAKAVEEAALAAKAAEQAAAAAKAAEDGAAAARAAEDAAAAAKAAEEAAAAARAGGAVRRMLNRKLSMAWEKWQFTAAEMVRQQFMMSGVLNRMVKRAMSAAWEKWQQDAAAARAAEKAAAAKAADEAAAAKAAEEAAKKQEAALSQQRAHEQRLRAEAEAEALLRQQLEDERQALEVAAALARAQAEAQVHAVLLRASQAAQAAADAATAAQAAAEKLLAEQAAKEQAAAEAAAAKREADAKADEARFAAAAAERVAKEQAEADARKAAEDAARQQADALAQQAADAAKQEAQALLKAAQEAAAEAEDAQAYADSANGSRKVKLRQDKDKAVAALVRESDQVKMLQKQLEEMSKKLALEEDARRRAQKEQAAAAAAHEKALQLAEEEALRTCKEAAEAALLEEAQTDEERAAAEAAQLLDDARLEEERLQLEQDAELASQGAAEKARLQAADAAADLELARDWAAEKARLQAAEEAAQCKADEDAAEASRGLTDALNQSAPKSGTQAAASGAARSQSPPAVTVSEYELLRQWRGPIRLKLQVWCNSRVAAGIKEHAQISPHTLEEVFTLSQQALRLPMPPLLLFTAHGEPIRTIRQIQNGMDVVVSMGEEFEPRMLAQWRALPKKPNNNNTTRRSQRRVQQTVTGQNRAVAVHASRLYGRVVHL